MINMIKSTNLYLNKNRLEISNEPVALWIGVFNGKKNVFDRNRGAFRDRLNLDGQGSAMLLQDVPPACFVEGHGRDMQTQ